MSAPFQASTFSQLAPDFVVLAGGAVVRDAVERDVQGRGSALVLDSVVPVAAIQAVGAVAAIQDVVVGFAEEAVDTRSAAQDVISVAAA